MKYIKVKDNQLFTPIIGYRRGDLECTAIGAIHIAKSKYYDRLQTELDKLSEGFYEGVKPLSADVPAEKKKYLNVMEILSKNYKALAKYLEMEVQKERLHYGKLWKNPDMRLEDLIMAAPDKLLEKLSSMKAWELEELYVKHPKELSRMIKGVAMFTFKLPLIERCYLGPIYKKVILDKRNQLLFKAMESKLEDGANGKFGVIYGAAHLKGIDWYLKKNRFKEEGRLWISAWEIDKDVNFWKAFKTIKTAKIKHTK